MAGPKDGEVADLRLVVLKAIREDLDGLRTDVGELRGELREFRDDVDERFGNVDERLNNVDEQLGVLGRGQLETIRRLDAVERETIRGLEGVVTRLDHSNSRIDGTNTRLDGIWDLASSTWRHQGDRIDAIEARVTRLEAKS